METKKKLSKNGRPYVRHTRTTEALFATREKDVNTLYFVLCKDADGDPFYKLYLGDIKVL